MIAYTFDISNFDYIDLIYSLKYQLGLRDRVSKNRGWKSKFL